MIYIFRSVHMYSACKHWLDDRKRARCVREIGLLLYLAVCADCCLSVRLEIVLAEAIRLINHIDWGFLVE